MMARSGPENSEKTISDALTLYGDISSNVIPDDESGLPDTREDQRIRNIASMGALFLDGKSINRENIEAVSAVTKNLAPHGPADSGSD